MSLAPLNCERIRRQVALGVDEEPSRFERAARAAHLLGCPDCRRFEADVRAFTQMLREAPLEPLERPVVVRRARPAWRSLGVVSPAAVAALVLAFVGVSGQFATGDRGASRALRSPTVYPTASQLASEQAFIEALARSPRLIAANANLR